MPNVSGGTDMKYCDERVKRATKKMSDSDMKLGVLRVEDGIF